MAKEKFVRSKPHVNVGSWIKQKLGFSGAPVEPPIEPLGPELQQKGMAFNPEEALGASALRDTDGDRLQEVQDGWQEPAYLVDFDAKPADPDNLKIDDAAGGKLVVELADSLTTQPDTVADDSASPWMPVGQLNMPGSTSEPPGPSAANASEKGDIEPSEADEGITDGGAQAPEKDPLTTFAFSLKVNSPGATSEPEGVALPEVDAEVLVELEPGEPSKPVVVGGLWNGQAGTPAGGGLEAADSPDVEVKHAHVYQHNQTDLEFQNERVGTGSELDEPVLSGRAYNPEPSDSESSSTLEDLKVNSGLKALTDPGNLDPSPEGDLNELPDLDD